MAEIARHLSATIADLSAEYVLVQAWKKTSSYIRYHNWFADTLELDQVTVNLPLFLESLARDLTSGTWESQPMRLVPAPKSQPWSISEAGRWQPVSGAQSVKWHLAPSEDRFNATAVEIHGFRPAQWLIGYEWAAEKPADPLWLTSAICYDATDLKLASDLRERSDVFAIPALNQDVGTFDHMAAALHYHMYQLVVVANNGSFGGSNAHIPKKEAYIKQVFHMHGQPQATISFFEIDEIAQMKARVVSGKSAQTPSAFGTWKYPPAGM